jgi:hypothetical protein
VLVVFRYGVLAHFSMATVFKQQRIDEQLGVDAKGRVLNSRRSAGLPYSFRYDFTADAARWTL